MAGDRLVLRDVSACWCDEQGRLGPPGRIRPMRMLIASEAREDTNDGQRPLLAARAGALWLHPFR